MLYGWFILTPQFKYSKPSSQIVINPLANVTAGVDGVDGEGVIEGVTLGVGVGDKLIEGVGVTLGVVDGVGVMDGVALGVVLGVGEFDGVGDGVDEGKGQASVLNTGAT